MHRRTAKAVEVKLPCDDVAVFEQAGFELERVAPRRLHDVWIFELPDGKLRKGQYLSVRFHGDSDGVGRKHSGELTYSSSSGLDERSGKTKGGKAAPGRAAPERAAPERAAERFETTVERPSKVLKIFKRLGLRPGFRYSSYYTSYRVTADEGLELSAVFEETPIGSFLTLEGERETLDAVVEQLGYTPEMQLSESFVETQIARSAARGLLKEGARKGRKR